MKVKILTYKGMMVDEILLERCIVETHSPKCHQTGMSMEIYKSFSRPADHRAMKFFENLEKCTLETYEIKKVEQ